MASMVATVILVACGLVAYFLLLKVVPEAPQFKKGGGQEADKSPLNRPEIPFATAFMRLKNNRLYVWYLLMKVPLTFLGQLPFQLLVLYFQNNMGLETLATYLTVTQAIAILGALLSAPLQLWVSKRYGRKWAMSCFLGVCGSAILVAVFVPFDSAPEAIYVLAPILGVCLTLPNVMPDAMLGDIIDYDELLTGERAEALYTTVETNLQQGIEVVLAIALLIMGVAGYKPLGGCSCGCGVNCPNMGIDYARFVCDGFVGYACDDTITSDTSADNPLIGGLGAYTR